MGLRFSIQSGEAVSSNLTLLAVSAFAQMMIRDVTTPEQLIPTRSVRNTSLLPANVNPSGRFPAAALHRHKSGLLMPRGDLADGASATCNSPNAKTRRAEKAVDPRLRLSNLGLTYVYLVDATVSLILTIFARSTLLLDMLGTGSHWSRNRHGWQLEVHRRPQQRSRTDSLNSI